MADGITTIVGLSDTIRFDNALDRTPPRIKPGPRAADRATPRAAPRRHARRQSTSPTPAYWTPDQVGNFYHFNDLFAAGLTGKGKTIALLELGQSRPSDTAAYLRCFGLHNTVKVVPIDGGALPDTTGTLEAEIDIQEAATQAPGATIVSYEAPNDASGEYDAYSRIVNDNRAQVVSTSWGKCELALELEPTLRGQPVIDALHTLFQQAAAQGQSVFAATGDTGSEDCYDGTTNPAEPDAPSRQSGRRSLRHRRRRHGARAARRRAGVERVRRHDRRHVRRRRRPRGRRRFLEPLRPAELATARGRRDLPDVPRRPRHLGQRRRRRDVLRLRRVGPDNWVAVGGTSIATPLLAGLRRRHRARLPRRTARQLRPEASCARGDERVRHRAHRRHHGHQLAELHHRDAGQHRPHPQPRRGVQDREGLRPRDRSRRADRVGLGVPADHVDDPEPRLRRHPRDAARRRSREGDHQVRHQDREGAVGSRKTAVVVVPKGGGTVGVSGKDPIGTGNLGVVLVSRCRHRRVPHRRRRRPRLQLRRRARTARRTRRRCTRRSSAWRSTMRPAATGSRRPTATSTTSTHRSSATRAAIRSTNRSSGSPRPRTATATGSSRATAASSRSGRRASSARRAACTSTNRSSASRTTPRPAATGSSRPTAGSSRSTRRSTDPPARSI